MVRSQNHPVAAVQTLIKKAWGQRSTQEAATGYVFMAPAILIVSIFLLLPIVFAVVLAFQKVQLLGEVNLRFVGWKNFVRMISDDRVWIALRNTAQYAAIVVPIQTALGLALALLLNVQFPGAIVVSSSVFSAHSHFFSSPDFDLHVDL